MNKNEIKKILEKHFPFEFIQFGDENIDLVISHQMSGQDIELENVEGGENFELFDNDTLKLIQVVLSIIKTILEIVKINKQLDKKEKDEKVLEIDIHKALKNKKLNGKIEKTKLDNIIYDVLNNT